MNPIRNPFSPGAGAPPPELAGREDLLASADILFARTLAKRHEKSMIIVGLRGVGKTVLLVEMQNRAEALGFKAISVEAMENKPIVNLLVPQLRKILFSLDRMEGFSQKAREGLITLKSFLSGLKLSVGELEIGVDADLARGVADSGDLELDLPDLFESVAEAAKDRKVGVALFIDELQYLNSKELSAIIMAMHRISKKQLPLVLVGAGLPQLPGLAGESKSYAERLFSYQEVGALNKSDAIKALREPVADEGVSFDEDAISEIVKVTQGYPYYIQEWGSNVWILADQSPIDLPTVHTATAMAIAALDKSFFRVRFDRLTPREKDYLRALAELGQNPQRSGDVAKALGLTVNNVGPLRDSLIKKGMLYSPAHGETAFTVPLFDEFMKREMPNWVTPKPKGDKSAT